MNKYIKLSNTPDEMGNVHILGNQTKGNYIKLKGIESTEAIYAIHAFLCRYKVWDESNRVIQTTKPASYIPEKTRFHDISFVLRFYELACLSQEMREKIDSSQNGPIASENLFENSTNANTNHLIVKKLDNPHIDKKIDNSEPSHKKIEQTNENKTKQPDPVEELVVSSEKPPTKTKITSKNSSKNMKHKSKSEKKHSELMNLDSEQYTPSPVTPLKPNRTKKTKKTLETSEPETSESEESEENESEDISDNESYITEDDNESINDESDDSDESDESNESDEIDESDESEEEVDSSSESSEDTPIQTKNKSKKQTASAAGTTNASIKKNSPPSVPIQNPTKQTTKSATTASKSSKQTAKPMPISTNKPVTKSNKKTTKK